MQLQATDPVLVQNYINGDEKALEILINKHNQRLTSFIYSKGLDREITEDIFQDTFIKVINTLKRGAYNEEGKFLPWIMRIAHNMIIDTFRKNKRYPTVDGGPEFDIFNVIKDEDKNIDQMLIEGQINEDLRKLIEFLPEEQKQVLKMRHFNEMSFKDIAEDTGVSINTALGRMRYALINLRKLIEEHDILLIQ